MTNRRVILVLVGSIGLALFFLSAVAAQSGDAIPGGIYHATTTESTGCDEGDIITDGGFRIHLNSHGTRVVQIVVNDVTFMGTRIGSFSIPADTPIEPDGTFSGTISFTPVTITAEGRFVGDTVSGTFEVRLNGVLECAATFTGRGEPPPEREPVTFTGVIDATGDCGGGTILLTLSGDMRFVQAIDVEDLSVHGAPMSGSARFDTGTVPIAEDGSFGWTYFPGSEQGQEIAILGSLTFFRASVEGAVTVSPSECGAQSFSAGLGLATRNDARGGPEITSLGQGGGGPGSEPSQASRWLAALAAAGAALFGLGAASRARRSLGSEGVPRKEQR